MAMTFPTRHRKLLLLAALLLAAYALRLYRLDYQSLWWDEGISLHLATSSAAEIARDRLDNIHPPLYFFLLKGWLALVGVSPFTGRYLSALAGLGQVALVFAAARYWAGRAMGQRAPAARLAAGLLLISPLSVIYSQEIRVYALLPVAYLAMLLLTERLLAAERLETRRLVALAAVAWLALHLHYIALFALAYVGLWGLIVLVRRRDVVALRRWIVTHAAVALASLPWMLAVVVNWAAVRAEANAGTFTADPVPIPYLFAQVWAFHLTGLAGALASQFVRVGAAVAFVLLLALFAARVMRKDRRATSDGRALYWRIAAHWTLPLLSGLFVWSVRSFSHPRYIVMFAVMLIPLVALLAAPARRPLQRLLALALVACVVVMSFWGLRRYFFDAAAAKPDIRGIAGYLETAAAAGDLILVPDTDWSLPFEYVGEAAVLMPELDRPDSATLNDALDCAAGPPCAESGRVFVVDYPRGTRDWQQRLPFELERRGHLAGVRQFNDVELREYRLTQAADPLPACDASGAAQPLARFGPLQLRSAWIEQGAAAGTAVSVALCWRANEPATAAHVASLVLHDPVTGERVAQADMQLLNRAGATAEHWRPGESVMTFHRLPLPPGTPPIELDLSLGVASMSDDGLNGLEAFDVHGNPAGQLFPLGIVSLSQPLDRPTSPYDAPTPPLWPSPIEAAKGLQLLGAQFNPGPYRPGQNARVGLTWRATAAPLPDLRPALLLAQGGRELARNDDRPVNGRFPTGQWQVGQMVFEYRDVRIPAAEEGTLELVVVVDGQRIELGVVEVSGESLLFERPPAQIPLDARFSDAIGLVGFDPPNEAITAGEPATLTLYWQSLPAGTPTSYTVFVHLLAEDGTLIAQHDSIPALGQRPTNEWLAGEFIVDTHELAWRDINYSGPASLAVGLYDAQTGQRLTAGSGADSVVLPTAITVTAP